jgi:hypothetical protein
MTDEKVWRETVQNAVEEAVAAGMNASSLARRAGFSPSGLANFRSSGIGGYEKVKALEETLESMGYLNNETPEKERGSSGVTRELSNDLRSLADILDGQYAREYKARKFRVWVEAAHEGLDQLTILILRDKPVE